MKTADLNLILYLSSYANGCSFAGQMQCCIKTPYRDHSPPTSVTRKITTAIQSFYFTFSIDKL
jgi:hypothetical protein